MNRINVDEIFCKGCLLCVDACPAEVLAVSGRRNAKGYLVPEAKKPDGCTGCQSCELICPDLAIEVERGDS